MLKGASIGRGSMTESVRSRNSKWDVEKDPIGTGQDNAWSGKERESIPDKVSQSEWNSSKGVGSHDPKWSVMEANSAVKSKGNSGWTSWESSLGNRGEQKDEKVDRDCNDSSQTLKTLGENRSYSMTMSPSLDGQRQQNHSQSPKNDWSRSHRSRSRSPLHGSRRRLDGWNDRIRSGSVVSAPQCNDFLAGRCRRGSQCRFLHQDNHDYEGRRHSERGPAANWGSRHERGTSSAHPNNEEQSKYSRDKISHGYENDSDGDWEKHEAPRKHRPTGQCNEFLKGRCYRVSSCKYAHHGSSDDGHRTRERALDRSDTNASFGHGNRREPRRSKDIPCKFFAAGNCRNGENCRFSHEGATRDTPEGKSWDNRWDHNLDSENRSRGGPKWSDKAADSAHGSPEGRSRSDRRGHNLISENRSWIGPKWSDKATDAAHGSSEGRSLDDMSWGGPKWSDKAADSDVAKSSQWKNDKDGWKIGVPVSQSTEKSLDDRWGHNLDNESKTREGPTWSDKPADQDVPISPQRVSNDKDASAGVRESRGHGKLLNAANMPSAEANIEQYPRFNDNKETGHNHQDSQSRSPIKITLPTSEQNMTREASGQRQRAPTVSMQPAVSENVDISSFRGDAAAAFLCKDDYAVNNSAKSQNGIINGSADIPLTMFPVCGQSFDHKDQSVDPQPHSDFDINGQSQQILPRSARRGLSIDLNESVQQVVYQPSSYPHHQTPSHQGGPIGKADMVDPQMSQITCGTLMAQNIVTSEQVAQISNISASLAQIFGKVQHLPHLYADLNSFNSKGSVTTHPYDAGPVAPLVESFIQPNQVTWSQKQYDPISDSMEFSKSDFSIQPPGFSANPIEQNKTTNQESHTLLKSIAPLSVTSEPNGGNHFESDNLEETLHQESHELKRVELVADERADDITMKEQDTVHSEDMDADGQVDEEGKKNKDAKGMRMFKFALVEFIKEILKPTWKEGQMSKEVHKTIVKKVVDKVTGTIGAHIPQTKEKIDLYLSHSKPKLTKLVQAYVEKYLKS